jgi:AraC-like DNA-binding protein
MPLVDDGWTGDSTQTAVAADAFHAWREPGMGSIWIATHSQQRDAAGIHAFVSIEIASGAEGTPVSVLNVSRELLRREGIAEQMERLSGSEVADPVLFELALAVVEAHTLPRSSAHTRSSLISLLCAQLAETASALQAPLRSRGTGFEDWQRQTLEATLSSVGAGDISLERFADRCGLSVCHFARVFKLSYGMPFHQYLVRRRIARACALLSGSQESISQIALACGFSDQSSFTRRFSAQTGTPPAAWRRSLPLRGAAGAFGEDMWFAVACGS